MSRNIPDGITRTDVLDALRDLDQDEPHEFGPSTGYDLLFEGKRYPPKAVVGLAARRLRGGRKLIPREFSGGIDSKCFRVLEGVGFVVVSKVGEPTFPDEIPDAGAGHREGAGQKVMVNRYERSDKARAASVKHYGTACIACGVDLGERYGPVGEGLIHVHHVVPLAEIGEGYVVDPVKDLRPVCPNCHAIIHRTTPPSTVEEVRAMLDRVLKE